MPTKKKPAWARHKKPTSSPELTYPEGHEVMGANTIKITITGNGIWARQTGPDSVEVSDVPWRGSYDKRTQVVVNAQYLRSLVDATCKDTCQAYESTLECETCWVELLRRDATAAIDAAGGGK